MTLLDRLRLRRKRRVARVRKALKGGVESPRLSVFRSARHIYAQAIDDKQGTTITSVSSREKIVIDETAKKGGNINAAAIVGRLMGERLKDKGVKSIVFDRGGAKYHGRVRALAESVRECGIKF